MPFAGFSNFDECVAAQKSKGRSDISARKICGYIQSRVENPSKAHLNKDDPAQIENLVKEFYDGLIKMFDVNYSVIFEKPKTHESSSTVRYDLRTLLGNVDDLLGKVYDDGKGFIQEKLFQAYSHGDMFGQIMLGASPKVRQATWRAIGNRVLKTQSDFKGITDETSKRIRGVIADGIIAEKSQGEIIADIQTIVGSVSSARAETMVRSETVHAVNEGVKDRYQLEEVDLFQRLEAEDEKTCDDWEFNIDDDGDNPGGVFMGCVGIDGQVFTRAQADQVDEQTHPNCRGTWKPYIDIPGGRQPVVNDVNTDEVAA